MDLAEFENFSRPKQSQNQSMKFSRDNICHKVFAYKQKLKGKGITYYIWKINEIALS